VLSIQPDLPNLLVLFRNITTEGTEITEPENPVCLSGLSGENPGKGARPRAPSVPSGGISLAHPDRRDPSASLSAG